MKNDIPADGEVFTIAVAGAKLTAEQIHRVNAALTAATMGELANLDFHGDMTVTQVVGAKTNSGHSIAEIGEFDDFCGTGWPGKFRGSVIGGGGKVGPIINGIIIDRLNIARR